MSSNSKCPKCGAPSYLSFMTNECSSTICENYSAKAFPPPKLEADTQIATEFEDTEPQFLWSSNHFDFGDS